ncbi:extracellular calcium-sensing receptor-like [Amphiura filiformis]|uniref:extracellular calcium-sensing receptor-like n=1 Tax=Amphiura filiformis TaxID=82378 RepID=UPI003B217E05
MTISAMTRTPFLCLIFVLNLELRSTQIIPDDSEEDLIPPSDSYSLIGRYYFGGLFNIHYSRGGQCRMINTRGLQRMYAMVYAIQRINERQDILPNITIGFDLHGTCADPNIAVAASLDFITSSSVNECKGGDDILRDFVGVVGPTTSNSAVSVASLFGLFKIPEISYSATSSILSEIRYAYFTRTVPTDSNQATALADIAAYFDWSVVAAISTDDLAYGIDGRDLFVEEAAKRNVCVAYTQQINAKSSEEYLKSILEDLRELPNIKVIVAFATEEPMLKLFNVFASHNASGYTWLGTDAWTLSVALKNTSLTSVTKGMLGLRLHSQDVDGFEEFLRSRTPVSTQFKDPFIINYWEDVFECYLTDQGKNEKGYDNRCRGNETLPTDDHFYDAPTMSTVFDSVEVIAKALHEVLGCGSADGCREYVGEVPGDMMLQCMKNVNFTGYSDYRIDFNSNGDLLSEAWYDVVNLQPASNCSQDFDFKTIGHWRRSQGGLGNVDNVFWSYQDSCRKQSRLQGYMQPPASFCSRSCKPGERRTSQGLSLCCWDCVVCPKDHYSDTFDALSCTNCSEEQISNENRTECLDLEELYLNPLDGLSLAILCIACFGVFTTLVVFIIFTIRRNVTIVYYACAETHAFSILICVKLCFCFSALSLIPADYLSCRIVNGIQMLPITLLQCFLILTAYINYKKKLLQVTARKQYLILLMIISLHTILVVAWYFTSSPEVSRTIDKGAKIIFIDCGSATKFDTKTILFLYNIALDCTGIAIGSRIKDVVDNFYEGKFVFFSFVIHVMLWVTTFATYLAITPGRHYQPIIVSVGMLLTGFALLGCIYVPKLYIMQTKADANEVVDVRKKKYVARDGNEENKHNSLQIIHSVPAAKGILLDNYRKAIEAVKGEKHQAVRVATIYNERIEDLQLRYRKVIGEKKDILRRMRHQRVMSVVGSPLVEAIYC